MSENKTEKKLYTLTEEHRAQLEPWAQKWIKIALRTEPQTKEDRDAMLVAMDGLYKAANFEPPKRRVFCASPLSAAIAASTAAGVHWLRANPDNQKELFGRVLSEDELMVALDRACERAVKTGVSTTLGKGQEKADPKILAETLRCAHEAVVLETA